MAERKKIGEILLQAGAINAKQLEEALKDQKHYGGRLGTLMLDRRYIDERSFLNALSQQLKVPAVDFSKSTIPESVIHLVAQDIQEKHMVFPVATRRTASGNVLILAMADPTNVEVQDQIRFLIGYRVEPVITLESVIRQSIREYWYRMDGKGSFRYRPDVDLGADSSASPAEEENIRGERIIDFQDQISGKTPAPEVIRRPAPKPEPKPAPMSESKLKAGRELVALLRLLAKKGVISEKEYLEELKKTK